MSVDVTGAAASTADYTTYRLRTFVEGLGPDELETVTAPVELADVAARLEGNPRAVLFTQVGPERASLVGNVVGSRSRLARAFGVTADKLLPELLARLTRKRGTVEVARAAAPVQEVVLTGDDADFTTLPIHLQHGLDGGPYVSASIDYVKDPRTGWTNVGVRRLMLRGRREAGIDLVAPSDLRAIYEAAVARGARLPISFVVGAHPLDGVAATMRIPVDEIGLVACLRDAPLPLVKCVTNDLLVPADGEYVLEGYLDELGFREAEGPYGEFLGYYGAVKRNPVFHLTAVTHRRDPLFQTMTISGPTMGYTDSSPLIALRTEAMIWRALEGAVREPVAVYATGASGGMFNVRIAIRQRVPGEARNAIAAAFASLANIKNVFVVDPDVDVFSDQQMDWALATRFQATRDLVIEAGFRALPLDPSLGPDRLGSKAGFDLTWPFGAGAAFDRQVPAPPAHDGQRFASVVAALEDGPKLFMQLMDAVGSRDGREIVRMLEDLRLAGALDRDAEGRYRLVAAAGPA
ncbi:MAG TPA: UbiD family decarboxylase [Caulobacteraceae bacterium]|jgi:UbiD family decarboxylase|nr:UbiD family decarboxylase [Caulobacteraceae bacterium]